MSKGTARSIRHASLLFRSSRESTLWSNVGMTAAIVLKSIHRSPNIRFERYFDVVATAPGEGEILVVARQAQDPIVSLVLKATISAELPGVTVRTNAEANALPTRSAAQHFQLRIHDDGDKGFTYELDIPGEIPGLYPPLALEGDKVEFIENLFEEIETYWKESVAAPEVFKHKLRARGSSLAQQLLPLQLRKDLWKHRDKIDAIVVLSTEPFIPWELLLIDDPDQSDHQDARFLAEMGLIRWLYNQNLPTGIRVRPGFVKYVIPDYCRVKGYYLPSTAAEGSVLGSLLGAVPVNPTYLPVLNELKVPGSFDVLHFAGHGEAEFGKSNVSRILLQGRVLNNEYHRESIDDGAVKLSAQLQAPDGNQPFIFLNACQTGRNNYQLTSMGGFADAFLAKGAGAFVSSLWVTGDRPSTTFAKELYSQLVNGATLAQATVQARNAAKHGGDPTWLAYTVYGRPECRFVSKPDQAVSQPG